MQKRRQHANMPGSPTGSLLGDEGGERNEKRQATASS